MTGRQDAPDDAAAPTAVSPTRRAPRWLRWTAFGLGGTAVLLALVLGIAALWITGRVKASLPQLEGEATLAGLEAVVTVERDELGIPTIVGASRRDVARATGFVHAQDRFFQMDMLRRRASGRLAELLGGSLLSTDRRARLHGLARVAAQALADAGRHERAHLEVYAEGVNAGLAALEGKPFEYVLARTEPEPWHPEDTLLVLLAMYLDLQDEDARLESDLGVMRDVLPPALFEFLAVQGTSWDAPLVGGPWPEPPLPGPEVIDLRDRDVGPTVRALEPAAPPDRLTGSNNFAVAGTETRHGRALVANDMHLGIRVPNTWYRAAIEWPAGDGSGEVYRVTGVTLPGTPAIIAGSNGRIAWGHTNSYADWTDLVVLEIDPDNPELYLTPDGPRAFERRTEVVHVHGGEEVSFEVRETIWGPVIDEDHQGRPRAVRWVAQLADAVNVRMAELETARGVDEALAIAPLCGTPGQNLVVADHEGRIGWTLLGRLPRRVGHDGRFPVSWADGERGWRGWLDPGEYPKLVDPPWGRLWTANNRTMEGESLRLLGDGGYGHGARASQLRDDLFELEGINEMDLLGIQLDDRALFLAPWRDLLLELLTDEAIEDKPARAELRDVVDATWTGRASVDSAAFRMVNAFHLYASEAIAESITAPCKQADPRFNPARLNQIEGPLWRLVTERPPHFLDPAYETWEDWLLAAADRVIDRFAPKGPLAEQTWGRRNLVRIRHPFSAAVPFLGRLLDMEPVELPGHWDMPRVQTPSGGASERFVVSPGHEEDGIFHMPGGQCGNPLSPHYRDGFDAWAAGEATPFLPGPTVHTLTLTPGD